MDGLAATRQIRNPLSAVRWHQIPIIAMTAYAMQGDREKCLQAGMDGYITKPVEVPALIAVLEKWLNPAGVDQRSPQAAIGASNSATTTVGEIPVFDRAALMGRVMNDETLARVVIEGFLGDLPGQIEQLKRYAVAGEVCHVEQQAHKIKGAVAMMGGEALRAVAAAVEEAAKAGNLAAVSVRMGELDARFEALKAAITHEI